MGDSKNEPPAFLFDREQQTDYIMPVTKISMPMAIRITPPKIEALFDSLVPNFLPIISPPTQIAKVTAAKRR